MGSNQDFTAIHEMIDYVDSLPEGSRFNYYDPLVCLFGYGVWWRTGKTTMDHLIEQGSKKKYYRTIAAMFKLTVKQFEILYLELLSPAESPNFRDKKFVCERARQVIYQWELVHKDFMIGAIYEIRNLVGRLCCNWRSWTRDEARKCGRYFFRERMPHVGPTKSRVRPILQPYN